MFFLIIEYPIMDDFSMLSNQLVEHVKLDISFSIKKFTKKCNIS